MSSNPSIPTQEINQSKSSIHSVVSKKSQQVNIPYSPSSLQTQNNQKLRKMQEQIQGKTINGNAFRMLASKMTSKQWLLKIIVSIMQDKAEKILKPIQSVQPANKLGQSAKKVTNKKFQGMIEINETYQNLSQFLKNKNLIKIDEFKSCIIIRPSNGHQKIFKLKLLEGGQADWKSELVTQLYCLRQKLQKIKQDKKQKNQQSNIKSLLLNDIAGEMNQFKTKIIEFVGGQIVKLKQQFNDELEKVVRAIERDYKQKLELERQRTRQLIKAQIAQNISQLILKQDKKTHNNNPKQALEQQQDLCQLEKQAQQVEIKTQNYTQNSQINKKQQYNKNPQENHNNQNQIIVDDQNSKQLPLNTHFPQNINMAFYRGAFKYLAWPTNRMQSDELIHEQNLNSYQISKKNQLSQYNITRQKQVQVQVSDKQLSRSNSQITDRQSKSSASITKSKGSRQWNCYNKYVGAHRNQTTIFNEQKLKSLDFETIIQKYEQKNKNEEVMNPGADIDIQGETNDGNSSAKQLRLKSILQLLEFFEPNYNASVKMLSRLF